LTAPLHRYRNMPCSGPIQPLSAGMGGFGVQFGVHPATILNSLENPES
jgi:hypothetical protein